MDTLAPHHWNNITLWAMVAAAAAIIAILSIRLIADQPYFGGGRKDHSDLRKKRYLRGEITTEEYVGTTSR